MSATVNLTVGLLRQWFSAFNVRYFDGRLPEPRLVVNRSRTMLGQFSCRRVRKGLFGGYRLTAFTIKVSEYYVQDEHRYKATLLHEMIHYHLAYTGQRDASAHGPLFRAQMERLNRDGWGITISSRTERLQLRAAPADQQYLIILMRARDGRCFESVVNPAYRNYIDRQASRSPEIAEHYWTVSRDVRYATWPKARSLRGRRLSADEFQARVEQALKSGG